MRENSLASIGWLLNARDRVESALAPHFRELPPDVVEEFFLVCENKQNWKAMIDLVRDENGTRQGDIASIEAPTLLIWGEEDLAYPPDHYAARFDADLPNSELLIVPDAGHYPYEEQPALVIDAIKTGVGHVQDGSASALVTLRLSFGSSQISHNRRMHPDCAVTDAGC